MDLKFPVESYTSQYIFWSHLFSVPDSAVSVPDPTGFYVILFATGPATYHHISRDLKKWHTNNGAKNYFTLIAPCLKQAQVSIYFSCSIKMTLSCGRVLRSQQNSHERLQAESKTTTQIFQNKSLKMAKNKKSKSKPCTPLLHTYSYMFHNYVSHPTRNHETTLFSPVRTIIFTSHQIASLFIYFNTQ